MASNRKGKSTTEVLEPEPVDRSSTVGEYLGMVDVTSIRPSVDNPRDEVADDEDLGQLAASIGEVGLLSPLTLAPGDFGEDGQYDLVAGHRRLAACIKLGMTTVPAMLRTDLTEGRGRAAALVENLHRKDLTALEEARGFAQLVEVHGYSQARVAQETGTTQPHVSKRLSLLKLPKAFLTAIEGGALPINDALDLTKIKDKGIVNSLAAKVQQRIDSGSTGSGVVSRQEVSAATAQDAQNGERKQVLARLKRDGRKLLEDVEAENPAVGAVQLRNYGITGHIDPAAHADLPCAAFDVHMAPTSAFTTPGAQDVDGIERLVIVWTNQFCTDLSAHPDPKVAEAKAAAEREAQAALEREAQRAAEIAAIADDPVRQAELAAQQEAEEQARLARVAEDEAKRKAWEAEVEAKQQRIVQRDADRDRRHGFMSNLVRGRLVRGLDGFVHRVRASMLAVGAEGEYLPSDVAGLTGLHLEQAVLAGKGEDLSRIALASVLAAGDSELREVEWGLTDSDDSRRHGQEYEAAPETRVIVALYIGWLVEQGYALGPIEQEAAGHGITLAQFFGEPVEAVAEDDDEGDQTEPDGEVGVDGGQDTLDLSEFDAAPGGDVPDPDDDLVGIA